jgi:hypothetical protein
MLPARYRADISKCPPLQSVLFGSRRGCVRLFFFDAAPDRTALPARHVGTRAHSRGLSDGFAAAAGPEREWRTASWR